MIPTTNLTPWVPSADPWEQLAQELTPVQQKGWVWFKRDDLFAPLGPGGINGSKLRQCIWLISRAARRGAPGIISGASVKSPQLMMGTAVAKHYGLRSHHIIGATQFPGALKHISVAIADALGAEWTISQVAYNPMLQRAVAEHLSTERFAGWMELEYGISLSHLTCQLDDLMHFHAVGAAQVANLPESMTTLIIPAGSCNTATSILFGLALHPPPKLERVVLVGIGPDKLDWMRQRLDLIAERAGLPIAYPPAAEIGLFDEFKDPRYEWEHLDLFAQGIYDYQDEQPCEYGGIHFHPTYEGKVMYHLLHERPELLTESTCMWIVGGPVDQEVMKAATV